MVAWDAGTGIFAGRESVWHGGDGGGIDEGEGWSGRDESGGDGVGRDDGKHDLYGDAEREESSILFELVRNILLRL
jgi:hypothetical protein